MSEPTTVNVGLIVPNTGDLVGVWGSNAINPDLLALDGFLGGVQIVSASNAPITLTSPSGFTPTPSGGPTQAQNLVLSCMGTLTANVQVTLPIPGSYIVENFTTGNFVLSFAAAGSGRVVAVDQGEEVRIYNNGTNVRFVNLGRIGHTEIWAGLSAMPAWVGACTVPPYLLCDGSVYNFSTYPYLGARLLGAFGGNGITTFGVPDLRGRVPLAYDGTGIRITAAGCGLNGQTLGAALDEQTLALAASQIPALSVSVSVSGSISGSATANEIAINAGSNAVPSQGW
jgi:microcystin-dependent protein